MTTLRLATAAMISTTARHIDAMIQLVCRVVAGSSWLVLDGGAGWDMEGLVSRLSGK